MQFLWTNENCSFRQIIILSQDMHEIWQNGRGSWKMVNNQSSQSLVKWWRYSTQLKIKLQTCIAQALFDRQPCNFHLHMRLLMPYNFAIWTYDLWPLYRPPFWIIWKTVKSVLLLGFLHKVHKTFYTWTLDIYQYKCKKEIILSLKNEVLMSQWKLRFYANYLPLTHACGVIF